MTARVAAGYRSATKFAEAKGFKVETYRKWERGGAIPKWDTLKQLCNALGITPNDLLWDHEK
jgi:transcriptional regulator with XRE-family HTH domain